MNMIINDRLVKIICLMLISTKVMIGQSFFKDFVSNDTIRYLNIPERSKNAISASEFVNQVIGLNILDREKAIIREILSGNVPSFSRKLKPLKITKVVNGKNYELIFFATCDYMAIGSNKDYLYVPIIPSTAQYLADNMNCLLPTKKIVDTIYSKAEVKLKPQPIPPSDIMTTVPLFRQHTDSIKQQIMQRGFDRSADNIIAGHKKDLIISNIIYSEKRIFDRVIIYGWHLGENNPIQPIYNGHNALYADYSHGMRLISKLAYIKGNPILISDILKDKKLYILLSNEGVITKPNYPRSNLFARVKKGF